MFFPAFEFIDRTYNNLEESDFSYDEIKAVFPEVLTVKYEDGKYMVKDVGADKAKVYNDVDYKDIELSLVDGWWICELDEEIYNDESIKLFVYFEGEIDGIYWNITYTNGKVNSDLYLMSMSDDLGVLVYYDDYNRVVSMYYVGDRLYNDEYKHGALDSQEGSLYVGDDHVYIEYLADGSFESARIYIGDDWYYYYPDGSWEKGVKALLTPPAGFENADVAYFESILPTTINCAHENCSEADCTNPERCLICGIVKDGSEALGHSIIDATCTDAEHCEVCGEIFGEALGHSIIDATCTDTEHCEVCGEIFGEALGHSVIDATCNDEAYCEVCGEILGEALGHDWKNATYSRPKTCKVCGKTSGKPLEKEPESETDGKENESEADTSTGSEIDGNGETELVSGKPHETEGDTATKVDDETNEAPKKGGCGSSISIGAISIVAIAALATLGFRKKEV